MDSQSRGRDRQHLIYGVGSPASADPLAAALASSSRGSGRDSSTWKTIAAVAGAAGVVFSAAMGAWAMVGHLVLPEPYTYANIYGARQGLTTAASWVAGAKGQIEGQNLIARGTSKAEGERQATVIQSTTPAQAAQNAAIQAATIAATAKLQASASCYSDLLSRAQIAKATCVGTGVAGGECDARADIISAQLPECGSLDPLSSQAEPKEAEDARP